MMVVLEYVSAMMDEGKVVTAAEKEAVAAPTIPKLEAGADNSSLALS